MTERALRAMSQFEMTERALRSVSQFEMTERPGRGAGRLTCCINFRLLDFCPASDIQGVGLFPSSGETGRRHLLSWVRQEETLPVV